MSNRDGLYKINSKNKDNLRDESLNNPPFGAGFDPAEVEQAVRLEVWGTLFSHADEFVQYELYDIDNNLIAKKKVSGY